MSEVPNTSTLPPFTPSVMRAYGAITSSPNAMMNIVWLSLAGLLSGIWIGVIPVLGWGAELLQRRCGRPEYDDLDIDSDRIGDYLGQGLWPFLVYIVVSLGGGVVLALPAILVGIVVVAAEESGEGVILIALVPIVLLILILSLFLTMLIVPMILRAQITQDFGAAFDFGWSIRFIKLMFGQLLLQGILFYLSSVVVLFAGMLICFVGYIPATGIVFGATQHMLAQFYESYLSRGGEPIPPHSSDTIIDAQVS